MRVERGASQILFGLLPGQTADLEGRIWRVANWVDPVAMALDQDSVRQALISAARAVGATQQRRRAHQRTCGLASTSRSSRLNMDRGVLDRAVPTTVAVQDVRQHQPRRGRPAARAVARPARRCSSSRTTPAARHGEPIFPAAARRTTQSPFACPAPRQLGNCASSARCATPRCSDGFPFQACDCGDGAMSLTVHRAAVVYLPPFRRPRQPARPCGRSTPSCRWRWGTSARMGPRRHGIRRPRSRSSDGRRTHRAAPSQRHLRGDSARPRTPGS